MTNRHLLARRDMMLTLGRGSMAVAVVALTGCASSTPTGPTPTTGSTVPSSAGLTWERVNLGFVSAYVLVRGGKAAIVDTGVGGSADAIGQVLSSADLGWDAVSDVILTHHHSDHAGSISDVLDRATAATGHVGEADLAQVTSSRPLNVMADGAEILGLQIVATPGHTIGHVSVFDTETGVLVVGDAMTNNNGLAGSNPSYTDDEVAAAASVKKLAALPVTTVLFGHGEPLTEGAADALKALADA